MNRRFGLIVLTIAFSLTTFFVFAQSEPMANEECTADNLTEPQGQINDLYTEAQTAFDNGDIRGWLDNLRAVSWLTNMTRALCDNYSFGGDGEGSSSTVIGPVIFTPGIYTATATTEGFLIIALEAISGDCGRMHFSLSEGDATNGAQEVFRVEGEPCTALLDVSLISVPWTLEFSLVSSGD